MTTPAPEKVLTLEEFDCLPESIEGGKMELVDGRVVTMTPVTADHGELQTAIAAALLTFVRPRSLGKVFVETAFLVRRDPDVVRAPDVSFLSAANVPAKAQRRRGSLRVPPDLAIEVTSPGDISNDLERKVAEYLDAGSARVWVVWPELQSITVYRASRDAHIYRAADTLTSDDAGFPEPGFALPLAALFESLE